jgi:CubicO group peptidase (beta-lactamase class C family)
LIKWLFKWLSVAVLFVFITAVIPAVMGAFGLYWQRYATTFLTNPLDPGYDWYKPLELVESTGGTPFPTATEDENPFPRSVLDLAEDYAASRDSDSLLIAHGGKLVLEEYWNDNDRNSLFPGHSMTKVLPAILIGHAIAEGAIESADVSVTAFLPEWDSPRKRDVTIRHLLHMASGIKEDMDFSPRSMRMKRMMGTDIVGANLAVDVRFNPGEVFGHYNPNSELLGIILERATERRFADYLKEKLWAPMGGRDVFLFVDELDGMVHTDCCMWSSIGDWMRIGELLRNKGLYNGQQIIPEGWVDEMLKPSRANPNYGMQLWLGTYHEEYRRYDPAIDAFANYHAEPFLAGDVFFLDGLGKKRLYVIPSYELVILRTGPNSSEWDDSRLPNILVGALQALEQNAQEKEALVRRAEAEEVRQLEARQREVMREEAAKIDFERVESRNQEAMPKEVETKALQPDLPAAAAPAAESPKANIPTNNVTSEEVQLETP